MCGLTSFINADARGCVFLRARIQPIIGSLHPRRPDELLSKLDRSAIGVSLETRFPLPWHGCHCPLQSTDDEYPQHYRLIGDTGDLLRQRAASLIEWPKAGFKIPKRRLAARLGGRPAHTRKAWDRRIARPRTNAAGTARALAVVI